MMKHMNTNSPTGGESPHPLRGLSASDLKNPSKMLEGLHALHVMSGTDSSKKFTLLTTGFDDHTLRRIADEAAHKAKEVVEIYSIRRKVHLEKEVKTPIQVAQKLKAQRIKTARKAASGAPLFFLSPKGSGIPDPKRHTFVGNRGVENTPAKKNLLAEFEETQSSTLTEQETKSLKQRLKNELALDDFSPIEIAEAKAVLADQRKIQDEEYDEHSTSKEARAVQDLFNLACVYILKHAANEELSRCKDADGLFLWNRPSTDSEIGIQNLRTCAEGFKSRAFNLANGVPARTAMNQFEHDSVVYEWFISLFSDRSAVPDMVSSFKSLLVGRLEAILSDTADAHLLHLAASDSGVQLGTKSKFEFYKFHLGLTPSAKPKAPAIRFLQGAHPGDDAPSGAERPEGDAEYFVGAMGVKGGRPLSGNPTSRCVGEKRTETYSKSTRVESDFAPDNNHEESESAPEPEARSNRPPNPQANRRSERTAQNAERPAQQDGNRRRQQPPADNSSRDVIRLIGEIKNDLTKKIEQITKQVSQGSRAPRDAPYKNARSGPRDHRQNDRPKRMRLEANPPEGACSQFVAGRPCNNHRCGGKHGLYNKSAGAKPCPSETGGMPCPFIWMERGCYNRHTAKNA